MSQSTSQIKNVELTAKVIEAVENSGGYGAYIRVTTRLVDGVAQPVFIFEFGSFTWTALLEAHLLTLWAV